MIVRMRRGMRGGGGADGLHGFLGFLELGYGVLGGFGNTDPTWVDFFCWILLLISRRLVDLWLCYGRWYERKSIVCHTRFACRTFVRDSYPDLISGQLPSLRQMDTISHLYHPRDGTCSWIVRDITSASYI